MLRCNLYLYFELDNKGVFSWVTRGVALTRLPLRLDRGEFSFQQGEGQCQSDFRCEDQTDYQFPKRGASYNIDTDNDISEGQSECDGSCDDMDETPRGANTCVFTRSQQTACDLQNDENQNGVAYTHVSRLRMIGLKDDQ